MSNTPDRQRIVRVYSKCEDKIEQGILDKVAKPELVDMFVGDKSIKEVFCDQFEEVQNFLHLSDAFNDAGMCPLLI